MPSLFLDELAKYVYLKLIFNKGKGNTKRRVQFNTKPSVIDITPLVDKQEGMRRLPEQCMSRDLQLELESPEKNGLI